MNKEECERAYANLEFCREVMRESIERNGEIINPVSSFDKAMVMFARLIDEHFDNPPLKFEELKESEVYWHVYYGWIMIKSIHDDECIVITTLGIDGYTTIEFEENSFYRKQVE